ncbi:HU family DNA-binding protein [Paenibacillus chitinolyticus]|uniref:HU family DNA-binding protein n=1 Tax=Paenibacillus chitinolyticus TaxID=79263 RepID=UPI003671A349
MNKEQLVTLVANETGMSKKDVETTTNKILETISEVLKKGEKVALHGFGAFEVRRRKARKGRNPSTGDEMIIQEMNTPTFSAGKKLKESVN